MAEPCKYLNALVCVILLQLADLLHDQQFKFQPIVEEEQLPTFDLMADLSQTQSEAGQPSQQPILQPHTHTVYKVISLPAKNMRARTRPMLIRRARKCQCAVLSFQDLTFLPQCPRDGTLNPLEMAALYNSHAHPEAVWQTAELESGFNQDVASEKVLLDFIGKLPDYMSEKAVGSTDVSQ